MRRDWFSTPVAAAVAAPLILGMQPTEVAAVAPELVASKSLAQVTMPGQASFAVDDSPASGVEATTTTTTNTTGAFESDPPADGAASDSLDDAPPVPGIESDAIPPAPDETLMPFTPRGDDELPSEANMPDNPYLRAGAPTSLREDGKPTGAEQEYGAFLPPTQTESDEVRSGEAGTEMLNILGEEVFNRRVNITTPPDTEVAEVIRLLAERAQLNFVYGQGVIKGRITLNLRDVPLGVALQSLLSSQELAIVREGANVMRIAPRQSVRPGNVDLRTVYIKLNWVPAPALQTTLNNIIGNTGGTIRAHKETNTLIITDAAPNVALLRDLVAQLDVPEKQVMIEARMVEMILGTQRTLGSNTRLERQDSSGNSPTLGTLSSNGPRTTTRRVPVLDGEGAPTGEFTNEVVNLPARAVDAVISGLTGSSTAPSFSFGGVVSIFGASFDVASVLDALETRNMVNVLASPRVITLNNQEAEIDIQREIPYLEAQQGASQGAVSATVKFKDAGVRLAVLPTITNNGYVRMRLTPEQRIQSATFPNPTTGSDIPIIDRRTAVTNVIVKDEDTVVLGGLREINAGDSKQQVPWIGQAPIIGWFFKRDAKFHTKNDLMLFVTPHIVKAPVLTPAENYKYTRVDAHWDLPDFFFDDSVDQRESKHRFEMDMNPRDHYPQTLKLPPSAEFQADLVGGVEAETTTLQPMPDEMGAPGVK